VLRAILRGVRRGAWVAAVGLLLVGPMGWASGAERPQACILRLKGVITQAYAEAVKRKIQWAVEQGADTFILELDTPGGTVQHSIELADYIFQRKDIKVIAYIHPQALSGGTVVALACQAIYIQAGVGKMGDVAPITPSGEELGEKFQSYIRLAVRNYARARGYPEALVDAMVSKRVEVYRLQMQDEPEGQWTYLTGRQLDAMSAAQKAGIVRKEPVVFAGELLVLGPEKAVEFGIARKAVDSTQQLYDVLKLDPRRVVRLYLTGSERLLVSVDLFTPLLIVAGFVLLFIEVSHPGFGLPGILGLACFAAFFLVKFSLHYARALEVLLFVAGLALLLIEVFIIPGFGVTGALGIVLLFASLVLASQEFSIPHGPSESVLFQWNILKTVAAFALTGVAIAVLLRFLPSLPVLGRIVHRGDEAAATIAAAQEQRTPGLSRMVGQAGTALTQLRPSGKAEFGDRLLDVVTEGEFLEKGTPVRITRIDGNRIVVAADREGQT